MNHLLNTLKLVKNNLHGIYWTIFKCLVFSISTIITSRLLKSLPSAQVLFSALLVRLILLSPWLIKTKFNQLKTNQLRFYLARSLLSTTSIIIFYEALKRISINEVTAITYSAPIFTVLIAYFFLEEQLTKNRLIAVLIGFLGVLIVIKPVINQPNIGIILALIVAPMWSLIDLITKKQARIENLGTQTFYNTIFALLFALPGVIGGWIIPDLSQILIIILVGLLSLANTVSLSLSYRAADLVVIAPFVFTKLLFTCLFTYLLNQESPTYWQVIGSMIIIISNVWIIYLEKNNLIKEGA